MTMMQTLGIQAKEAAKKLALITNHEKNTALTAMASCIAKHQADILNANQKDLALAQQKNLSGPLIDRLLLNPARIENMANAVKAIAALPDPIGTILATFKRPNGLHIDRIRVPIGVIGVIYESRPNVTVDAAALCLKSGNAVILRGGSESFHTNTALMVAIEEALSQAKLPETAVQMVASTDRSAVTEMLKMDQYIDVIIPRGGQDLIKHISSETRIPLFKHLAGLCHTYLHTAADKEMAKNIVLNAKMRRTGICGATEVLLIDEAILHSHLPPILQVLLAAGCEIRGDEQVIQLMPGIKVASKNDYDTEFLAPILAVKVVKNIDEAIQHIAKHGSKHTDAIVTEDENAAARFFQEVDSAIIMHNASTQFADGYEFGMGAEMGIATGKLHARGPVGVEQLTTFKYLVHGSGQVRG